MDTKKYLKDSSRTASSDYSAIGKRMNPENLVTMDGVEVSSPNQAKMIDLQHAALGMVTESAEFADMLKKHLFYGKPLDEVNLREEVGDLLWYCAMALRALNTDFDSVMERNIEKLKARYPQKFTEENAVNRNLDVERKILEKNDQEK